MRRRHVYCCAVARPASPRRARNRGSASRLAIAALTAATVG